MKATSLEFFTSFKAVVTSYYSGNLNPSELANADETSEEMMAQARAEGINDDTSFGDIESADYETYLKMF